MSINEILCFKVSDVKLCFPENNYVAYGAMAEELIYYYHPDHLGTATYLTDINGEAYEIEDSSNTSKK